MIVPNGTIILYCLYSLRTCRRRANPAHLRGLLWPLRAPSDQDVLVGMQAPPPPLGRDFLDLAGGSDNRQLSAFVVDFCPSRLVVGPDDVAPDRESTGFAGGFGGRDFHNLHLLFLLSALTSRALRECCFYPTVPRTLATRCPKTVG